MNLLVAAVVAGLLPVGSSLSQDKVPKPPQEEKGYAKVELKGGLYSSPPVSDNPLLTVWGDQYEIDLSEQKELQGEAWRKLEGKTVIVTGALKLPRKGEMARVLVSSIRVVKEQ